MTDDDDFPLSPTCWAEPSAYYAAFLQAETLLSNVPAKSRGTNLDRRIHELTSHLYTSEKRGDALFRARLGHSEVLSAVWLSKVRVVAEWLIASDSLPEFRGLDEAVVRAVAQLSASSTGIHEVAPALLSQGVIVVYEPAIPGMKVDGAVFKLPSGHPVIGLSMRYARVDYYWFTLLHELAHVVLHSDLISEPILDDFDAPDDSALVERQADRLASDAAIPRHEWRACPAKYSLKVEDVQSFAKRLNIAPEIVAGRLRRELRRYELFSELVNKVDAREALFGKQP
jgi:HTH-type transcriptional regulator / antitoxin HigA